MLFFPGLVVRKYTWSNKAVKQHLLGDDIDHITLEPNMRRWHLTSISSAKKDVCRTREIDKDVHYWFGMSIRGKGCLEVTPRQMVFRSDSPQSDSQRRLEELVKSREGSEWPLILMDEIKPDDCFIHFDVFVDVRRPQERKPISRKRPPFARPVTTDNIRIPEKATVLSNRVEIPSCPAVVVINTHYVQGELSSEAFFGGY